MSNTSNWITVAESSFPWERDALQRLLERNVRLDLTRQIAEGVHFAHEKKVVTA